MTYLCLYDGSSHSQRTLDYIKKFGLPHSKVIIYGAFPQVPLSAIPGATDWASKERDAKRNEMEKLLTGAKQELTQQENFLKPDDVSYCVVEADDIRDPVLDFVHDNKVDTIVCGTRGHGAVKRAILGSLSTYLVENAATTVVICRDKKT